jgi:hypothetical protein
VSQATPRLAALREVVSQRYETRRDLSSAWTALPPRPLLPTGDSESKGFERRLSEFKMW